MKEVFQIVLHNQGASNHISRQMDLKLRRIKGNKIDHD